jgi:hypothetical protein
MVERVMALAQEFAAECAAAMLTGHTLDHGRVNLLRDLLKLLHPPHVDLSVFRVVGEIAPEQDKIRTLSQGVDHVNGALETPGCLADPAGR